MVTFIINIIIVPHFISTRFMANFIVFIQWPIEEIICNIIPILCLMLKYKILEKVPIYIS